MTWNTAQSTSQGHPRYGAAKGAPLQHQSGTGVRGPQSSMSAASAAGAATGQGAAQGEFGQPAPTTGQQAQTQGAQTSMASPEFAVPRADVTETPESFLIEFEMPGFEKADISVYADENRVIVSGERTVEETEGHQIVQRERPLRLERTIQLPVTVDVEETMATYEAGVCAVEVPKGEAEERKRIGFQ